MKVQINDEMRDATPEEIEIVKKARADHAAEIAAEVAALEAAAAAKTSARVKLKALGLTDAEIVALVG